MKSVLTTILLLLLLQVCHAQISGVINDYTKVTGVDYACNAMEVTSLTGFSVGDTVLIIQMQGAAIDENNAATFGDIIAYNDAGNYEFAHIDAIQSDTFYFKNGIIRTYDPAGSVQIVRVPQYTDVTISGILTAQPWDGNTGGVLVFEASGTVTMNADIDVNYLGFRGGERSANTASGCDNEGFSTGDHYFYAYPSTRAGKKGEGIARYIAGKESGRGKQANGGGGGNGHNFGGGGGGNYASGGTGGNNAENCAHFPPFVYSIEPPNGNGGPGLGLSGQYNNTDNKIFMGGGGGGGHQNNGLANSGGNGGGIIIMKANELEGNGNAIHANGELTENVLNFYDRGDGGGGGGAGGTVLLNVANYTGVINLNVVGGQGTNTNSCTTCSDNDFGPGGGGGGGALWVSTGSLDGNITVDYSGGNAGISFGQCGCNWGATDGGDGNVITNLSIPESSTPFGSPCVTTPVELLSFQATNKKGIVTLTWQTVWEQNNDYFILEGSKDAKAYTKVAKVDGNGNVNTISNYSYSDYNSGTGIYYYRLKQVDYNGTTKVVGTRSVVLEGSGIKVYPNPFNDYLVIQSPFAETDYSVQVYGLTGELHKEIHITNSSGEDQLAFSGLTNGFYLLKIISGDQVFFEKVLKQ